MPRKAREFLPGYSYHITTRCNNRGFNLASRESRELFLHIIKKAQDKYNFKLYALCIMLNHVHYLLEPENPEDVPKIMHWINWYSAMCFNTILRRKGHFWEQRYTCHGFPNSDSQRALNTLRYIHANPKAAGMKPGFFYDFSNYGTYEKLKDDGITQWHPAYLELGENLDDCAKKYKGFCSRYKPKKKKQTFHKWGKNLLEKIFPLKKNKDKPPIQGQLKLPYYRPKLIFMEDTTLANVAREFIKANGFCVSTS